MSHPERVLLQVIDALEKGGIPHAVAGGFAVIFHGYERFTDDVDVLIGRHRLSDAMTVLEALGYQGHRTPLGARLVDPDEGIVLDLLCAAWDAEETVVELPTRIVDEVSGRVLSVVPVEHLVVMKLEAGRTQDDADVAMLLMRRLVDPWRVRTYIRRVWPALMPRYRRALRQAREDRGRQSPQRRGPETN